MPGVVRLQHTSVPMPPGSEDQARQFYGVVLNMVEKPAPTSIQHLGLVWYHAGDDEIHLFSEENFGNASVEQHFCLHVDDIDWYRQRLTSFGVPIEETIAVPNRPRFFVRDPFGNKIELTQVRGEYT